MIARDRGAISPRKALSEVGWRLFREGELSFRDRPVPRIELVDVYNLPMARRHKLQPKETPPTRRSSHQTSPLQLAKTIDQLLQPIAKRQPRGANWHRCSG
jgi:hypothetical protein